jgi:molybdenum cofactor synthesis domain-containing protein
LGYQYLSQNYGANAMGIDLAGEFKPLNIALLTVSDSRGPEQDTSGQFLADNLLEAGHQLAARRILPDDVYLIRALIAHWIADPSVHVILITGGTGFSERDSTPKRLDLFWTKALKALAKNSDACQPPKSQVPPSNPGPLAVYRTTRLSFACRGPQAPVGLAGMAFFAASWIAGTHRATLPRWCCVSRTNPCIG